MRIDPDSRSVPIDRSACGLCDGDHRDEKDRVRLVGQWKKMPRRVARPGREEGRRETRGSQRVTIGRAYLREQCGRIACPRYPTYHGSEAATRPTMRYVEIKSEAQLEVQSLHRVRGRLVAERTALINQLRALMLERGIAVPHGLERLGIDQQSPANRSIAISVKRARPQSCYSNPFGGKSGGSRS